MLDAILENWDEGWSILLESPYQDVPRWKKLIEQTNKIFFRGRAICAQPNAIMPAWTFVTCLNYSKDEPLSKLHNFIEEIKKLGLGGEADNAFFEKTLKYASKKQKPLSDKTIEYLHVNFDRFRFRTILDEVNPYNPPHTRWQCLLVRCPNIYNRNCINDPYNFMRNLVSSTHEFLNSEKRFLTAVLAMCPETNESVGVLRGYLEQLKADETKTNQ